MKRRIWLAVTLLVIFSFAIISSRSATVKKATSAIKVEDKAKNVNSAFSSYVTDIYQSADLKMHGLDYDVFQKAVTGYFNLKQNKKLSKKSEVITVIDFNKASTVKRMWIVDLLKKELVLNTWVAHGQGSGDNIATQFSDDNNSHQSSLGFYVTNEVYYGKHGRSLKLDGMDAGFNTHARERAVVLHAANYVCENTIKQLGRLGRSHGCPAVSPEVSNKIIDLVKGKNMIYVNANVSNYNSKYLNQDFLPNFASQPDSAVQLTKASF
ncbi:murein L,D-transpeptidase catalytic domain family protein [Mucilaginibacter terrae]|uniref:murein L,D-transpeptidase catalytic domain family protein n=1 Tax=Mucilaginibacter terrae TaxID=1955052 RepID=UPI00362907E5